jgi:hypothetical protein
MSDIPAKVGELSEQADQLPDGPSKVALLDEAVRLADSHNDVELAYDTRKALMRAATFGGSPEKAMVAFTWCIAQCDRDPETFDPADLLWEYKWVVSSMRYFPQISRAQIEGALDDMTRRYQQVGMGLRPIHKLRCRFAIHRGDRDEALRHQRLWRTAPAGWGNDCPACEQDDQVDYLMFMGKDERALDQAKPLVTGRMSCAEVPHITYANLLLPLLRLGQVEKAAEYYRRGYPMVLGGRDFVAEHGMHLTFLALTGNLDAGVTLLERHLPWALETMALARRFEFGQGARLLLSRLAEAGKDSLRLRLPKTFPIHRDDGQYAVTDLAKWFEDDCRQLAEQFDRRNETDWFARKVADLPEHRRWAVDYPLAKERAAEE